MSRLIARCQKCNLDANSFTDYISNSDNSEYLLEDGTTYAGYGLHEIGWCNSCSAFSKLFAPIEMDTLRHQNKKIINDNTGFFGNLKKLSSFDEDIFKRNLKLIEILSKRIDIKTKCLRCNSYEVVRDDKAYTKIYHKQCGGLIHFESVNVKINLRSVDPSSPSPPMIEKTIRITLLDANDNVVGFQDRKIKVIKN